MDRLLDLWLATSAQTAGSTTSCEALTAVSAASTENLHEDVLRLIFSFLTNEPSSATSISHESMERDYSSTLSSAASVSKSWYQPAIDMLYKHVRLRDSCVCVLFARALQNEKLATIVLSIQLPETIYLPYELSGLQRHASAWLGYFYQTNQFATSHAVVRIMAAAVRLRSLRGPFGGIDGQGDVALARLGITSKLQRLDIHPGTIHWITWTGASSSRDEARILHIPLLLRAGTIWSSLNTLVITEIFAIFNLLEVDAARFAQAFPVLRELVVTNTSTTPATLNPLLYALRNTLRTLTIWQDINKQAYKFVPLLYVENSCASDNQWRQAFDNLEHLICGTTASYLQPIPHIQNIGTLTRLSSLGVPSDAVGKIAALPPRLTSLIIYLPENSSSVWTLVTQDISGRIGDWVSGAPGLRQLVLSAPPCSREDSVRQERVCHLKDQLETYSVQLSFETT